MSVQSVVVDPADRLWILDTGSPMFRPTEHGGPKLVCVDLTTDEVVRTILFPTDVALPTTYLNDVRFDLRRGDEGIGVHHRLLGPGAQRRSSSSTWPAARAGGACTSTPHQGREPPRPSGPVVEGRQFLERAPGRADRSR